MKELEEQKKHIIDILRKTIKRNGIEDFIKYLEKETDFFEAPCSTRFHLSKKGGLAEHSLNVYELLKEKVERYQLGTLDETILICGLLHDLCKTKMYYEVKNGLK